ncbi:flavin-dependent oxidoreductase [Pseudonocardia sp. Ae406_Ps2]|uniref:LLM class flavin-dependent oxidoreductase n=1 Tax=unclassified Pseudonocardia TaxID=2619320 RepID=UPI00094ACF5B|nr:MULTISPECIES: LLM class flavin-dependent oxidoreductase [unclassified Pseudonocardia]OLM01941.1 flavin-dependent oxidoreductase [Pseudonocardia sp. Ae406_Ps2]OLM06272.1 flavin-dependent oxidoreductase [Pseudonocardia sp. Ae331_Ps2]OLM13010.1 flavin-dependent oxidoreductase [Pseudonocardia sp. Ae505_Ps2]OLM23518.1 flavin-dependent oxidoreductase [Pseudonocardia sp. Ae706_Ps2]OLM32562.1 flavin-dependent oxidoreductase [Pseudonocardia sp. Ae717_Ps2]
MSRAIDPAPRRIHLNAFDMTCAGHQSPGLWRHPQDRSHTFHDLRYWTELAQLLERGGFTSLFIADVVGLYDVYRDGPEPAIRDGVQVPVGDPTLAVSAMAAVTERLGFGITVSLTYEKPYALARRFSTLDHYTRGRVAWNVVTSYLESAARNLGLEKQVPHDRRYDVADEFMEVCYQLWEASWDDDAVLLDRDKGVYTDPAKVRPIGHHGEFFDVPGIGLTEPSPQRTPTIFQAGASARGTTFAARHAEGVFVISPTPETLAPRVAELRRQTAEQGRDPRAVKVFTMVTVVTGATDEQASERYADLAQYVSLEGALTLYGGWSGLDLSTMDPDEPLRFAETEAIRSAVELFTTADPTREWTPRAIAEHIGIGGMGAVVVGGPQTVADELERWAEVADVDGFNLAYAVTPGTFADVVEHVVPELRRRGVLAEAPEGATLREHLQGAGQARVRADHPAAVHARRRGAAPA